MTVTRGSGCNREEILSIFVQNLNSNAPLWSRWHCFSLHKKPLSKVHLQSGKANGKTMSFSNGRLGNSMLLPPANEVWGKVIFLHQFVILFTGGGACVVAPGGRAWCMHGCVGGGWLLQGVCMVAPGGHAWLWGGMYGCSRGGMCGCSGGGMGHAWLLWGVCMVVGGCAWLLRSMHVWLLQGGVYGCRGVVTRGGCAWLLLGGAWLLGGYVVAPGGACMVAWGVHGCSGGHAWLLPGGGRAWDTMTHGDTVNERAVRILLECILVESCFESLGQLRVLGKPSVSVLHLFREKQLRFVYRQNRTH